MTEIKKRISQMLVSAGLATKQIMEMVESMELSPGTEHEMVKGPIELSNGTILEAVQINYGPVDDPKCSIFIHLKLPNEP